MAHHTAKLKPRPSLVNYFIEGLSLPKLRKPRKLRAADVEVIQRGGSGVEDKVQYFDLVRINLSITHDSVVEAVKAAKRQIAAERRGR